MKQNGSLWCLSIRAALSEIRSYPKNRCPLLLIALYHPPVSHKRYLLISLPMISFIVFFAGQSCCTNEWHWLHPASVVMSRVTCSWFAAVTSRSEMGRWCTGSSLGSSGAGGHQDEEREPVASGIFLALKPEDTNEACHRGLP